jgi:hypothetical protein
MALVEELQGVPISASMLLVDDDGLNEKCSGLGIKVVFWEEATVACMYM